MAQSKRFLVIVDPTVEAQPALERAATLEASRMTPTRRAGREAQRRAGPLRG